MKKLKLFEEFSSNTCNSFSKIEDGEIMVNINKLKDLFSFVGEGVDDISFHPPQTFSMQFIEESSGQIHISDWNKLEEILKSEEGRNGFESYSINASHNVVILDFDAENYTIGY